VTWTQSSAPTNFWYSVASSADGKKLVAVSGSSRGGDGLVYSSSDSGVTWMQTTAPRGDWASVASSGDGAKLVAAETDVGPIYVSGDSGATWTQTSAPSNYWSSVASSADGTKLFAVCGPGIYASTDSGVTWTSLLGGPDDYLNASFAASSADGKKLAINSFGEIYTSSDAGASWGLAFSTNAEWTAAAFSADGSKLVAVAGAYSIASGQSYLIAVSPLFGTLSPASSSPSLSIGLSGRELGLSWLVPSTAYVLQQNPDLNKTNWIDMPMSPTLNFTDLNYQVTVSPSFASRFYRLRQQ
jgi:photosystem II stability/assembly factor-like uncharacterized protein